MLVVMLLMVVAQFDYCDNCMVLFSINSCVLTLTKRKNANKKGQLIIGYDYDNVA